MKRIFGALLTAALATTLFAAPETPAAKDHSGTTETGKKKAKKAKQKSANHADKTTDSK